MVGGWVNTAAAGVITNHFVIVITFLHIISSRGVSSVLLRDVFMFTLTLLVVTHSVNDDGSRPACFVRPLSLTPLIPRSLPQATTVADNLNLAAFLLREGDRSR